MTGESLPLSWRWSGGLFRRSASETVRRRKRHAMPSSSDRREALRMFTPPWWPWKQRKSNKARLTCQITDYEGKRQHLVERMFFLSLSEESTESWVRQVTLLVAGAEAKDLPEWLQWVWPLSTIHQGNPTQSHPIIWLFSLPFMGSSTSTSSRWTKLTFPA